jgi:RNA 3'-terminal phosphate cyclase (ATP)
VRVIDGSVGGGQILRSSLALSIVTGDPFRIDQIRAGRKRPGLMRQHLTAVRAAARVGDADLTGDELGSTSITFRPKGVVGGEHEFRISTAGSAGLVLQTVLPPLLTADEQSHIVLHGGTHNQWAPPFDFLDRTFLPLVSRMGPIVSANLTRHGFYPAGGGRFTVDVDPCSELKRLDLLDRGEVRAKSGRILISQLGGGVANREVIALSDATGWARNAFAIEQVPARQGPGNVVLLDIESDALTAVFAGFGQRGVRAERVADLVAQVALGYLASDAPVYRHLADQLLLPMAIGAGGSFRTQLPVDDHTTTNAALLSEWLGITIEVTPTSENTARIDVQGARRN